MTVAAVILAASPASALADADGTPGVRRLADVAWSGGATPVVVCSFDPDGAVAAALANAEVTLVDPVDPASGPVGQIVNGIEAAGRARRGHRRGARLAGAARLGRRRDRHDADPRLGEDRAVVLRPAYRGERRVPDPAAGRASRRVRARSTPRGCRGDLFADLEAAGVPFRTIETGDPGVVHDVSTPRADLPPYDGPPEPADARPEWGSDVGDESDDAPVPGPARLDARSCDGDAPPRRRRRRPRPRRSSRSSSAAFAGTSSRNRSSPRPTASLASTRDGHVRRGRRRLEWSPAGPSPTTGSSCTPAARSRRRRTGRSPRRSPPRVPGRDRRVAVQPRGARDRRGGRRPRRAPRDRRRGRSAATRWAARWRRSTSRATDAALDGLGALGRVRGDDLSAPTWPPRRSTGRSTRARRGCRARDAGAAPARRRSFVPIEGGNHEQMGWYTGQPNDPPATICARGPAGPGRRGDGRAAGRGSPARPSAAPSRPRAAGRARPAPRPRRERDAADHQHHARELRRRRHLAQQDRPQHTVVTGWTNSSTDVITAGSRGSDAWIAR